VHHAEFSRVNAAPAIQFTTTFHTVCKVFENWTIADPTVAPFGVPPWRDAGRSVAQVGPIMYRSVRAVRIEAARVAVVGAGGEFDADNARQVAAAIAELCRRAKDSCECPVRTSNLAVVAEAKAPSRRREGRSCGI